MKRNSLKFKKYLKNKKGFSLLELLCAVMIMAIAVSATATGLAISYQSITRNSLLNKASAKAQMYCDVIMTYVEKTPSNDPDQYNAWDNVKYQIINGDGSITNYKLDKTVNKLFADQPNTGYKFTNEIQDNIKTDLMNLESNISDVKQYSESDISTRSFNKTEVAYVIKPIATYYTDIVPNSIPNDKPPYAAVTSYEITVYVDYGTNGTTTCTGVITKNKYNKFESVT